MLLYLLRRRVTILYICAIYPVRNSGLAKLALQALQLCLLLKKPHAPAFVLRDDLLARRLEAVDLLRLHDSRELGCGALGGLVERGEDAVEGRGAGLGLRERGRGVREEEVEEGGKVNDWKG